MLSFSAGVKAEICREVPAEYNAALAECFGILLFCNSFGRDGIKIITESVEFSRILPKLFRKAFGLTFDVMPEDEQSGKYVFQIGLPQKTEAILNAFGFSRTDTVSLHVNLPIVEDELCKTCFFRGAFLAGGSVTDPAKGYHMELATSHQIVARECCSLFEEVMGFSPKSSPRAGGQVVYLKQSDAISDFLTYLGAPVAAMTIMETKLERELNNKVNRCCNCDEANTSKVVEAAQEHLRAIRIIRESNMFDSLADKMKEAILAREANPEASLSELAQMMEPPITKPAMNHRLKKLLSLAKELQP